LSKRQNLESKLPDQNNTFLTVKQKFRGGAYSFLPGEFERAGLDPQKLRFALEENGIKGDEKETVAFRWLNKLLAEGVDLLPYNEQQENDAIRAAKAAYEEELSISPSENRVSLVVPRRIRLNREILQATYSNELCPQRNQEDEVVIDAFFTPDSLDLLIKDHTLWLAKGNTSSPMGSIHGKTGGIDFRALSMTIQPMGSFNGLNFKLPQLSQAQLSQINIDSEIQQIKNMIQSGIIPSGQRVKELIAACIQKKELGPQADSLLLCISDIFKLEEENASESSSELREALVIVDSQN